jgi:hypothetical protein
MSLWLAEGPNCCKVANIKLNQRVSLRRTPAEISSFYGSPKIGCDL